VETTERAALTGLVDALGAGDRGALERLLAEDVHLRAALPRRDVERTGRAEAAALMLGWFSDATDIARAHRAVDRVGDVWRVSYRFTLRENGVALVVEQHAYCAVADGLIASIRLLCSGSRPAGAATLADVWLDARGEGCATLTPRIATTMRGLRAGQVLAVLTDDPSAPDGLAAWSRLTGHEIMARSAEPGGTNFFIRRS